MSTKRIVTKFDAYRGCPDFVTLDQERRLAGFGNWVEEEECNIRYEERSVPRYPGFLISALVFVSLSIATISDIAFMSGLLKFNNETRNSSIFDVVVIMTLPLNALMFYRLCLRGEVTLAEIERRRDVFSKLNSSFDSPIANIVMQICILFILIITYSLSERTWFFTVIFTVGLIGSLDAILISMQIFTFLNPREEFLKYWAPVKSNVLEDPEEYDNWVKEYERRQLAQDANKALVMTVPPLNFHPKKKENKKN